MTDPSSSSSLSATTSAPAQQQQERRRQTTSPTEARFLRWFRTSGGTLDARCRIQPIEGMGRGMVALEPIPANTTIFTIPRHVLLNLNTSALSAAIAASPDEAAKATWAEIQKKGWLPLILAMLWERRRASLESIGATTTAAAAISANGADADVSMDDVDAPPRPDRDSVAALRSQDENAAAADDDDDDEGVEDPSNPYATSPRPPGQQRWGPYFDIMPSRFSTPMFWPASDLAHLEGTSIVDKIARDQAEADYHSHLLPFVRAHPLLFGPPNDVETWYDLDSYHVMGSRILSRSFHVKSRKRGREGEAVDMDERPDDGDDQDDDGDEEVGEVMDDEQEGHEEGPDGDDGANDNDDEQAGDETRDTHDDDDGDGSDNDSDSSDDDDEDEAEQVSDISMTPMADMLNARFASDNARLFYKSHLLCMRTTRDVEAGAQIFNTYADPPNSDLLRRYGHVDEPNGNDVVELHSDLVVRAAVEVVAARTGTRSERAAVERDLAERRAPTAKQLKAAATGGGIDEELVALARILAMPREAFDKAKAKGKGPSARIESVEVHAASASASGPKKEVRVETSQILIDAIALRLATLPGGADVKADELLLYPGTGGAAARELGENERKALVVRLGEKRVLLDQKRTIEYVLDRIKADARDREKEKREAAKRKGAGDKDKGGKKARR
ncbi:uncharacterized protein PFL1_02441 [Pseudozyma flocculosa PF-1]|uniref:SET domain-containing protein n=1 Tax=Pseudozyma flocculosa PF-1 TaxID=1277687 RepID=A0A061HAX6_9BASI|nr:uncharacterized protein PFL1_02441 [Pseudozyma flocculosa PF-1]EPQ29768.1 hypothetical protein PFL1_02441 [Pseudozyma flocculosa PF-1]